jgi:hypothetical protein
LAQSSFGVPKKKIEISPWRKSANLQRRNQPPNVRSGKSQPNRRSNRSRRFFRVEGKMSTFGGPRDTGMSADEGLALFTQADLQDPKYSYLLGLQTDDVVRITISALRAIPVKPAKGAQQPASAIRTAAPTKPVGQALRPGALTSPDRSLRRG